ncbi:MAG TPA: rhomboid family intramembrane serine protease [Steroidobacteraceae bacterium]|nr:rhomboid family intramembrane serine protease [Steroidobacteraceae bacterium]
MTSDAEPALVEVFSSRQRRPCDERSFVLSAVGIQSVVTHAGARFILWVSESDASQAQAQLRQYELENRPGPPPPPPPRLYPDAWIGCVFYVCCLMAVAYALSAGLVRLDAFDVGDLHAASVQGGQLWRAWTALTLHVDGVHLAANLSAGTWFGYLAARQMGVGTAWFLIVNGAALANLLEGWLGPPDHRSVGASTAAFTALGLMAAYSWRERYQLPQSWARRWGPLVAGVVLLGWTGSGGGSEDGTNAAADVDVFGHVAGFAVGIVLGATAALPASRRFLERVPQWLAGCAALAPLVVAWVLALRS